MLRRLLLAAWPNSAQAKGKRQGAILVRNMERVRSVGSFKGGS
jgi:hypothetical protein